MGTFMGARRHVLHTFARTQSPMMKRRAMRYDARPRLPGLRWEAAPGRVAFGQVRRSRHRRGFPPCR